MLNTLHLESVYSFIYISIAVCEAALGVTIIITYVNIKGNEIFKLY